MTAPTAVGGTGIATLRLLHHQLLRNRPVWWSTIVTGFANPLAILLALGVGLGSQIDDAELATLGTDSYLAWMAPGILAVTAMDVGAREGLWPTMAMIKWERPYVAVLNTPMSAGQLGLAHVAWISLRSLVSATCFLVVLAVAGIVASPWVVGVLPVAALIAAAHGGLLAAFVVQFPREFYLSLIHRMVVFPLFLFSGAFFRIEDLPQPFEAIARVLPTFHGVEAVRDLVSGRVSSGTIGHLAILAAVALAGSVLAARSFVKNLVA